MKNVILAALISLMFVISGCGSTTTADLTATPDTLVVSNVNSEFISEFVEKAYVNNFTKLSIVESYNFNPTKELDNSSNEFSCSDRGFYSIDTVETEDIFYSDVDYVNCIEEGYLVSGYQTITISSDKSLVLNSNISTTTEIDLAYSNLSIEASVDKGLIIMTGFFEYKGHIENYKLIGTIQNDNSIVLSESSFIGDLNFVGYDENDNPKFN